MALSIFWEITFKLDGDYTSYDELIQSALNDDAYQKYFPGIGSEILLEQLTKFVHDPTNRPEKDGIDNGTLYKKENGRQIESTRRYYLVKEENLNEFNLYVKITKGRNLGFYRVYNNVQEVEKLIQFGINELKYNGQLPIVADYTNFALHKKFYVARERCEFISRLLNANIVATRNCSKIDYDVTKLRARQQTHKRPLTTVAAATITSTVSSSCPDDDSTDDEDSVNTDLQQSLSIVPKTPTKTLSTTTKTISHGNKTRKNKGRMVATTRSTPMQDRLRVRTKDNAVTISPSASLPQSAVAATAMQPKTVVSVAKKHGRVLKYEKNDENSGDTPVMLDTTTSTNGKAMKAKSRGTTNKRMKK